MRAEQGLPSPGVDGNRVWERDADKESEAPEFFGMFVMGHQIHAQILFFDHIHPGLLGPRPTRFADRDCLVVSDGGEFTWRLFYAEAGRPLGMELPRDGASPVVYQFDDWRAVDGLNLPFLVLVDDGGRQLEYRFTRVELGCE